MATPGGSGAMTSQKAMVVRPESEINQAWFTTRDDKQALHNTGVCSDQFYSVPQKKIPGRPCCIKKISYNGKYLKNCCRIYSSNFGEKEIPVVDPEILKRATPRNTENVAKKKILFWVSNLELY